MERPKLIKHETFKDIYCKFIQFGADENILEHPEEWMIGCEDEMGDYIGEVSLADILNEDVLAVQPCWAFIDRNKNELNYWIGNTATHNDVLHLIAHELAHLEEFIKEDEARCESYGFVATEAYDITTEIISDHFQSQMKLSHCDLGCCQLSPLSPEEAEISIDDDDI